MEQLYMKQLYTVTLTAFQLRFLEKFIKLFQPLTNPDMDSEFANLITSLEDAEEVYTPQELEEK